MALLIESALQYHYHTGYDRHQMGGHNLDWTNQPSVYKTYPHINPFYLPKDVELPQEKLSSVLGNHGRKASPRSLDVYDLARIFLLTYSLTAKARHGGYESYYRCVASAGALYPTEIYVATQGVNEVNDGIYHFSIASHGLFLLREGNFMEHMVKITEPSGTRIPTLTFLLSAIFFRSAWKYRDRSYRYHLLDTGHVIENLILALKSLALPFSLSYDFDDSEVNRLVGLDEKKEVSLAVIHVQGSQVSPHKDLPEVTDLPEDIKAASRVSREEVDYPAIREIYKAGQPILSPTGSEVEMINELGVIPEEWAEIDLPKTWPELTNYSETVLARRSMRNFVGKPISSNCLTAFLDGLLTTGSESMESTNDHDRLICTGFLIGNAEGLNPGFYLLNASTSSTGIVSHGFFTDRMSHICLDQAWLANAAVQFLFMANLDTLDQQWGARGYRYAMMKAGLMGERLYLMATAMGLGCCGIGAFFDGEASELLGLNQESRLLYLVAVGPVR